MLIARQRSIVNEKLRRKVVNSRDKQFTNISDHERLFRYDVMFSFLASGDPLESINAHRALFQKYGYKLTDATHLSDLIPLILDEEVKKVAKNVDSQKSKIISVEIEKNDDEDRIQ